MADFLIERLDQLDLRLRQLEEKQTLLPQTYFSEDLLCQSGTTTATTIVSPPQQCRTLSSALRQVRIKGTLMERLHLLETRITQLSAQLDKDDSTTTGSSGVATRAAAERQTLLNDHNRSVGPSKLDEKKKKQSTCALAYGRVMGDVLPKGNPELQAHKCRKKVKGSKEAIDDATCRNEDKRRRERTWVYKRWFPVGC